MSEQQSADGAGALDVPLSDSDFQRIAERIGLCPGECGTAPRVRAAMIGGPAVCRGCGEFEVRSDDRLVPVRSLCPKTGPTAGGMLLISPGWGHGGPQWYPVTRPPAHPPAIPPPPPPETSARIEPPDGKGWYAVVLRMLVAGKGPADIRVAFTKKSNDVLVQGVRADLDKDPDMPDRKKPGKRAVRTPKHSIGAAVRWANRVIKKWKEANPGRDIRDTAGVLK